MRRACLFDSSFYEEAIYKTHSQDNSSSQNLSLKRFIYKDFNCQNFSGKHCGKNWAVSCLL